MKYEVQVTRIGYACHMFTVEADSPEEARELAIEKGYNTEFSEHSSDYEADTPVPIG